MINNSAINENSNYEHILELHYKKNKTQAELQEYNTARANDPVLDSALYNQDKAEVLSYIAKIQLIMKKTAKGEKLTKEEQDMVDGDAELAQKVNNIKQQREQLEKEIQNATPEERKQILSTVMSQIASKTELTPEDEAMVETVRQLIYKYDYENQNNDILDKYKDLFAQNSSYEYNVG